MMETATIDYASVAQPAPGEFVSVAQGVLWLRMPLPFQLDHINLWLVEDGDGYVLIDTGVAMDSIRHIWDGLLAGECARRPIRRIIVTHYHPDHLGLAGWLADRLKVPVAVSQGEMLAAHCVSNQVDGYSVPSMVAQFEGHGLDRELCDELLARGNAYKRGVPELPAAYDRLMDGDRLVIGSREWRVIMGYGHSPEHAALYCASLGVLIAGDMVLPRISTNISVMAATPRADPLRLFLDSLERYARLPADTLVLPSHGKPFRGLRPRTAELAEHHQARCDELLVAASEPRSVAELMPVLFPRKLDSLQVMFAMGETIAHVNYLERRGGMRQTTGADGRVRYVKTLH